METVYKPKYIQIRDEIIDRIKRGHWKPNSMIPSDRELAAEFAVSRFTAIKAVQELEREGIVYREQGKGTFVSPSWASEGIEFNTSYKIGLVISDLAYIGLPYMNRVLKGVNEKLSIYGYNLVLFGLTGAKDSKVFSVEEIVKKRQVDGLLIDDNVAPETIVFLCENKFPFVQIGTDVGKVSGYEYSRVVIDSETVYCQGIEYLVENGRRRIAFLRGYVSEEPKEYTDHVIRKALQAHGIQLKEGYLLYGRYGEESGRQMAKKLFSGEFPQPDAIFANEDMLALGVIKEAEERGIAIPEDLMVVGMGDYLLDSFLTTFRTPAYEMGKEAANVLIRKLQHAKGFDTEKDDRVLHFQFIVRET